jgi:NADH:ubiquinone oxidoreductase subunit K
MNLFELHQHPSVYLILAALLFAIGLFGLLRRHTLVGMLISSELIFGAAMLNLLAVSRFFVAEPATGQVFVLFIIGLSAAEAAIALSIIIAVYRNFRSIRTAELSEMKG